MRKFLIILSIVLSGNLYSQSKFMPSKTGGMTKSVRGIALVTEISISNQIIADHSVVALYSTIPANWIDSVKQMWMSYPGESHAIGVLYGLAILETANATYAVDTKDYQEAGNPDAYTDANLRASTAMYGDYENASGWIYVIGEEDWWTSATATNRVKAGLSYINTNGPALSAIGFGWCWDATRDTASLGTDPVTGNHWYGRSIGSASADPWYTNGFPWGIDDADNAASGNTVNMDDYLMATQSYIDYCATNSIPTKVFFTTGPVDTESGAQGVEALYQGYLKFEHIRNYVNADATRILFDYADILCYDDNGTPTTTSWNGNTFPAITATNGTVNTAYHISQAGTVRLAKAMWWMLARMAGWDGLAE